MSPCHCTVHVCSNRPGVGVPVSFKHRPPCIIGLDRLIVVSLLNLLPSNTLASIPRKIAGVTCRLPSVNAGKYTGKQYPTVPAWT